ncbi:MAG: GNAT family N-acetyltransferase [Ferruginibacter sp.]|nr:GNAT family N-acetyltransferase [Ferruginibacter sp.]
MIISIRNAHVDDCSRMMELIRELARYEKAPDEVTVSFEHFVKSGFGVNPVWKAIVAEIDNVVQGFALYYIRYSTWKGQRLYLEDIIITEKCRGLGAGKLLFDELIKIGKKEGYAGMVWQVLEWNEPALNFYRKYPNVKFDTEWVNGSLDF